MKITTTYKCKDCNEVFVKKFAFLEHQNVHTGDQPFMCTHCSQTFGLIIHYVNHVRSKHMGSGNFCNSDFARADKFVKTTISLEGSKEIHNNKDVGLNVGLNTVESNEYKCLKCEKLFASLQELKNHKNCHLPNDLSDNVNGLLQASKTDLNKNFCDLCGNNFESAKKFQEHTKNFHNFVCHNCSKRFTTKDKLAKHSCFISLAGDNFICSCLQVFTKTSDFKKHIGDKPYSCCSCSMQFNTITNLVRHIRTHTKQKPYICKDCGRGFSQSAHLRNHSSIHLGIKAINCNECNFSCKTFNGLLKHRKKHRDGYLSHQSYVDGRKRSTHTSSCPVCNKKFLFKRNMAMHMKIHSNKASLCTECGKVFDSKGKLTSHFKACHREPSVCKTCGKVFASAVLLSAHEKIHVSDKLFLCNICNKTFSIKNYLVQHMKTHTNKKQFSCSKCGKLFKVAVSLKYHSNICVSLNIPV